MEDTVTTEGTWRFYLHTWGRGGGSRPPSAATAIRILSGSAGAPQLPRHCGRIATGLSRQEVTDRLQIGGIRTYTLPEAELEQSAAVALWRGGLPARSNHPARPPLDPSRRPLQFVPRES